MHRDNMVLVNELTADATVESNQKILSMVGGKGSTQRGDDGRNSKPPRSPNPHQSTGDNSRVICSDRVSVYDRIPTSCQIKWSSGGSPIC